MSVDVTTSHVLTIGYFCGPCRPSVEEIVPDLVADLQEHLISDDEGGPGPASLVCDDFAHRRINKGRRYGG